MGERHRPTVASRERAAKRREWQTRIRQASDRCLGRRAHRRARRSIRSATSATPPPPPIPAGDSRRGPPGSCSRRRTACFAPGFRSRRRTQGTAVLRVDPTVVAPEPPLAMDSTPDPGKTAMVVVSLQQSNRGENRRESQESVSSSQSSTSR